MIKMFFISLVVLFSSLTSYACLQEPLKLEGTSKVLYVDRLYDTATNQSWYYRDDLAKSAFKVTTLYTVNGLNGDPAYSIELNLGDLNSNVVIVKVHNRPASLGDYRVYEGSLSSPRADGCGLKEVYE